MKTLPVLIIVFFLLFLATGAFASGLKNPSAPCTGLIVDTSGMHLTSSMSPKVYDPAGNVVYGNMNVPPEVVESTGIVGYVQSLAAALADPRVGTNPLIIRGIRPESPGAIFPADPVISEKDADAVATGNMKSHFLDHLSVVFVIDPESLQPSPVSPAPGAVSNLLTLAPQQTAPSLFQQLGIDQGDWSTMSQDKKLVAEAQSLPPEARALYKNLSFFDKVKFSRQLSGTTNAVVAMINNREAFVNGNIMGHDVFQYMEASAKDDLQSGKISGEQYAKKMSTLETLSKLTPAQRSALVDLLDAEMQARGVALSD